MGKLSVSNLLIESFTCVEICFNLEITTCQFTAYLEKMLKKESNVMNPQPGYLSFFCFDCI